MNFTSELHYLSSDFYQKYSNPPFNEILYNKNGRAYNCLFIKTERNYYICLPFRSNMPHKYGYRFHNSKRAKRSKSGLDYKKMVIVRNEDIKYIDLTCHAVVDQDEYKEMKRSIKRIVRGATSFLDEYISFKNGEPKISKEEFDRRYTQSPLQYFNAELGLR